MKIIGMVGALQLSIILVLWEVIILIAVIMVSLQNVVGLCPNMHPMLHDISWQLVICNGMKVWRSEWVSIIGCLLWNGTILHWTFVVVRVFQSSGVNAVSTFRWCRHHGGKSVAFENRSFSVDILQLKSVSPAISTSRIFLHGGPFAVARPVGVLSNWHRCTSLK